MKLLSLLLLILSEIISPQSVSGELTSDMADVSRLFHHLDADRILLVGFPYQHLKRIQNTTMSTSYRRRGTYQSSTWSRRISSQIGDDYHLQKLTEWPMTEVDVHCAVYFVPQSQPLKETLELLAQDRRVQIVQKMHIFQTKLHANNDPYYKLQSNMHEMEINRVHAKTTGRDVTIAMIDTGVDMDHPDLRGQITVNENFASGISPGFTNDIHGTAVAGIIVARRDNKTGIVGVAPNAKLVALKACWPSGDDSFEAICNSFTLSLAINTAIKLGVKVLNMSLSGPEDPLMRILLDKATEKGILVVAADPGKKDKQRRFPASLEKVIAVQTMHNNAIYKKTINAPGENILTTLPHGTYDFVSGSSLAAAQISGIVALLLELNPNLTLDETKTILQNATSVLPTATNKKHIYGVNANSAVLNLCDKMLLCTTKL